ncbi:MAG: hypothetical protein EPN82_08660 [Bacteroidetes bacterium]|nr:MAG: hypothetical protein EPN82_08660 [Bacteroidota bacterium]
MKRYYYLAFLSSLVIGFFFLHLSSSAQENKQLEKFDIGLSYYHPSFPSGAQSSFSGNFEIFAAFPVSNNMKVYGILPLSSYSMKSLYLGDKSFSGIGNFIVGLKYLFGKKDNFLFKGGIALPTIGDNYDVKIANGFSYISRVYDLEKFTSDITSLFAEFQGKHIFEGNFFIGGGTGLRLLIWTGPGSHDAELFLPFNIFLGYEKTELIKFIAAFKGIYILTNENSDFGDNVMDLLQLKISYPGQTIEPALIIELPINDNYKKVLNNNIGFSILIRIM